MAQTDGIASQTTSQPGHGLQVLVVEDDPEINQMVGAYAELAGFVYRSALTGTEALEAVHRERPALMVLDLMLPDLDGMEICRRVKQDPETQDVPVVILTALDSADARKQGLASGASAYLTKPFDPDELMREMMRYAAR